MVRLVHSFLFREDTRSVLASMVKGSYRPTTQHRVLHYLVRRRVVVGSANFAGSHHLACLLPPMPASGGESPSSDSIGMWFGSAGLSCDLHRVVLLLLS